MLIQAIGRWVARLRDAAAGVLLGLRVSPNALTVFGFVVTLGAGTLIALGRLRTGGLVLIGAGACDILDGAVARVGGRKTPFGAFLDSSLDRIGDLAIFGGLAFHFAGAGDLTYTVLCIVALGAAETISYTRARAECIIESCKVGFWERGERILLIVVALIARREPAALWVLATLPWFTVFHRIWHVRRAILALAADSPGGTAGDQPAAEARGRSPLGALLSRVFFFCPRRGSLVYDLVAVVVLAAVLFAPI